MPAQSEITESTRIKRMLRTLKAGDRVRGTLRASSSVVGAFGDVLDPNPFQSDGVRRIRVQWDNGRVSSHLPASIEEAR